MSKINSRAKGCRGERALRDVFREAGFMRARRSQQYSGTEGTSDVTVPELPMFHFESKFVQNGDMYDWVEQAERDCAGKIPVVCRKKNNKPWLAILPLDELIKLIKFYRPCLPTPTENIDATGKPQEPVKETNEDQSATLNSVPTTN